MVFVGFFPTRIGVINYSAGIPKRVKETAPVSQCSFSFLWEILFQDSLVQDLFDIYQGDLPTTHS